MRQAAGQAPRAATLTERTIAYLTDSVITAGLWLLGTLAFTGGELSRVDEDPTTGVLAAFAFLLIPFIYFLIAEAATGTTPGKRLLGLHVTDLSGDRASLFAVTVRNTLRLAWAVGVLGPLFLLADAILVQQTEQDQRVGDLAARTRVVRTGRGLLGLG